MQSAELSSVTPKSAEVQTWKSRHFWTNLTLLQLHYVELFWSRWKGYFRRTSRTLQQAMSSMIFTNLAVQEPSKGMMIDNEKLRSYVYQAAPSLFENDDDRIVSFQFVHGQSNPTYLLSIGTRKFVLRKQPPGLLLQGAHDVIREASIIRHLSTLEGVPVPKIYCICTDAAVIGTPFYIMEHIKGIVHTDPGLPSLTSDQRKKTYTAATRVLASIHSVQVLSHCML